MSTILECKNLSKKYGRKQALDNITLSLESGKIIGLLGPNGSGKTTLIKLINGLLAPTGGKLFINGNTPGVESKKIVSDRRSGSRCKRLHFKYDYQQLRTRFHHPHLHASYF